MEAELLNIKMCEIEVINRAREDFGGTVEWEGFKASIAERGLIQPIAVKRQSKQEQPYYLLAGGRRHKAHQELGLEFIAARLYPDTLTELDAKAIELAENLFRKNLAWVEEIKLKREVHDLQVKIHGVKRQNQEGGWGLSDTGGLFGDASTPTISKDLKLADYLDRVPDLANFKKKTDAMKVIERFEKDSVNDAVAKKLTAERDTTPTTALHKKLVDSYLVGDFFEGVKSVPDSSIDIIELDWPYAVDLDVNKKNTTEAGAEKRDLYNEVIAEDYPEFVLNTLKECYRVMSPNSWIITWFSPRRWYDTVWAAMQMAGFRGRDLPAVWVKPGAGQTNQPRHYLASNIEYFFYAMKGDPEIVKQGRANYYTFKPVYSGQKIHPTERPIEMIQEVLATYARPGSRVMVPFLGSGNTNLAAANLNMTSFGWDLGEKGDPLRYKNAYTIKVHASVPPNYRSYKEE